MVVLSQKIGSELVRSVADGHLREAYGADDVLSLLVWCCAAA